LLQVLNEINGSGKKSYDSLSSAKAEVEAAKQQASPNTQEIGLDANQRSLRLFFAAPIRQTSFETPLKLANSLSALIKINRRFHYVLWSRDQNRD
jgi:hypothetical protein